jgi:hypothetical protein
LGLPECRPLNQFMFDGKPDQHRGILHIEFGDQVFAVAVDRELTDE